MLRVLMAAGAVLVGSWLTRMVLMGAGRAAPVPRLESDLGGRRREPTTRQSRAPLPRALRRALAEAWPEADPSVVWTGWLVVTGTLVVSGIAFYGPGAGALALAGAIISGVSGLSLARGRRSEMVALSVAPLLDSVARGLRSGASLADALAEAGSEAGGLLGWEVGRAARRNRSGASLDAAIREIGDRLPGRETRLAVTALLVGLETGGELAPALDGVAATVRDQREVAAEARALATQARASALMLVLAPLAFAVVMGVTDSGITGFLLGTPVGLACLAVALLLETAGGYWMARIVDGSR